MFERADRLVGIYKIRDCTSNACIDPKTAEKQFKLVRTTFISSSNSPLYALNLEPESPKAIREKASARRGKEFNFCK